MKRIMIVLATVSVTAAIARGQPLPDVPIPPDNGSGSGSAGPPPPPPAGGSDAEQPPTVSPTTPADPYKQQPPAEPAKPLPPLYMPEALGIPTGWLLPAAVIYSKTRVDTGGGVSSDWRVGLGDVAEFGVATTDQIRQRLDDADKRPEVIQPYITASFRLGVSEGRLFDEQPGMTLGFRKSFERNHDDFTTRIAELTLVASKHIGDKVAVHVGGAFWDASVHGDLDGDGTKREITLHDLEDPMGGKSSLSRQVRPFGGLEVRPLPHSQILVDLGWAPEFCYHCISSKVGENPDANRIVLKPILTWGVRYDVARWLHLESGVRVPDIGDANLLDAQIFGQITFTSFALRRAVESLK